MSPVATMQFSYKQILSLALQMSEADRALLCRELSLIGRAEDFRHLCDLIAPCDLSDDEIRAECEAVRQEMYEESVSGK